MHPYATDSGERKFLPLYFSVLSILAAWVLNRAFIIIQFSPPWWIDAPSVIGFYGLFYTIFDKSLWRMRIFRMIGLVKVPDLNGTWEGYIASSFDNHNKRHDTIIKIYQNWTQISIVLETNHSKSRSVIAAITVENLTNAVLNYEYLNEPMPNSEPTMHIHRGTTYLTVFSNEEKIEGEYYTGRDRQNFGILSFKRC